jgi:hypothetical protein
MSGGITQLVAVGVQDAYLSGNPEVSFFRSSYKRYTHFAASVNQQLVQGSVVNGGVSLVRFEKKGDLLSHVYLTAYNKQLNGLDPTVDWSKIISKVELLIGGQIIDTHDFAYMSNVEPVICAQTYSTRYLPDNSATKGFYPMKFFFCKDWQSSLPLVALQYHDVELRITWGTSIPVDANNNSYDIKCWTRFIYLDNDERDFFAKKSHDMLITQVNRSIVSSASSYEFALSQPVKCIAFEAYNYTTTYKTNPSAIGNLKFKIQINGNDIGEQNSLYHWQDVNQYYLTPYGYYPNGLSVTQPATILTGVTNQTLFTVSPIIVGMPISFSGTVPTGLTAGAIYEVNSVIPIAGGNLFQINQTFNASSSSIVTLTIGSGGYSGYTNVIGNFAVNSPLVTLTSGTTAGMYVGAPITFSAGTGTLPTNIVTTQVYFVSFVVSSTQFEISSIVGGGTIFATGSPANGTTFSIPAITLTGTATYDPTTLYAPSTAGLSANQPVTFSGTYIPAGIAAGTTYYVSNVTAYSFQVSRGGTLVATGIIPNNPTSVTTFTVIESCGSTNTTSNVVIIPFCLDTSKLQPTGSLNFSRIDTFRLVAPPGVSFSSSIATSAYFYSVNYNILRIQNGMGGILYAS